MAISNDEQIESWEMTAQEYLNSPYTAGFAKTEKRWIASFSGAQYPSNQVAIALKQVQTQGKIPNHGHWFDIKRALYEGKPVPLDVLKDYPDLLLSSITAKGNTRKARRRVSKKGKRSNGKQRPNTTMGSMR